MRRARIVVAALLVATGPAGCGKKGKPLGDETASVDPAPVAKPAGTATPVAPGVTTPADPVAATPADPAPFIPPFVPYTPNAPAEDALPVAPPPAERIGVVQIAPAAPALPTPPPMGMGDPKEKEPGGSVKPSWPREINGRTLTEFVRDASDPDPAIREMAFRTLPGFGPEIVRKEVGAAEAILLHIRTDATGSDKDREKDPGVRAAAYEAARMIGFDKDADTREAVRSLAYAAGNGSPGGGTRLHAVQTLAAFGPKAELAVSSLVGATSTDPAYETRRSVAETLGQIAYHERNGPNPQALECLVRLATKDESASVRLTAVQAIITLGPPYLKREGKGPFPLLKDIKNPADVPKVDDKATAGYVATIKKRLAPAGAPKAKEGPSPTGLVERDRQVEILLRLALIRLEPKELNDENLNGITKYLTQPETGPKLQALSVLGMMGEPGAKRLDDVVKMLTHEDGLVASSAVSALMGMGAAAKPAIPALEKLKERPPLSKKPEEQEKEKKYWAEVSDLAVKTIKDAGKPAAVADAKP